MKRNDPTKIFIIIGALLIIAALGYYLARQYEKNNGAVQGVTDPSQIGKTVTKENTGPDYVPVSVDTKNWKTYTNKSFGIQFKYPPDRSADVISQHINNLVLSVGGDLTISVHSKAANFSSLENSANALADLDRKEMQGAAAPVTFTVTPKTVGHIHGYSIVGSSAASQGTDITYETELGNYLVDFSYSSAWDTGTSTAEDEGIISTLAPTK